MPTRTAIAEIVITRRSTGAYSGGASTVASAGASEGATGMPVAAAEAPVGAFSGDSLSSGTRDASSWLVFEHHWWGGEIDSGGQDPGLQQFGERMLSFRRHARHRRDEIILNRRGCVVQQLLSRWGERNLYPPPVRVRRDARHEPALDQPPYHD